MKVRGLLLSLGFLTSIVANSLAEATVHRELVNVKTNDGITLDGALWKPPSGNARVGIVIASGSGAEFDSPLLTWIGEHVAQAGYIALSMNRRDHGEHFGFYNLEPSAMDHKYAIDLLAARGTEAIVLAGQSYGTVTIPYYVMASNDARVKAMILYAPLGDLRAGSMKAFSQAEYDKTVAAAREMVAAGRGKESFLLPPLLPGGRPMPSSYETFLDKRGPDSKAVPIELIKKVGDRPILGIRDPADPLPSTLPPAEQQLKAANKNLEYVLLPDIRSGRMDASAHHFRGREEEVLHITLDWLMKHKLGPLP